MLIHNEKSLLCKTFAMARSTRRLRQLSAQITTLPAADEFPWGRSVGAPRNPPHPTPPHPAGWEAS